MDENKRFAKNISVLAVHSENPMDIIIHEMASRNKRLQDRAKLETGTDIFNEQNCPTDPKKLEEIYNNASKGSEGKPKKGKDIDDDGDDTPKKLKKPNDGDGGEGGDGTGTGTGGAGGQGDPGKDGGKEPDETKKKAKQTASETVTALKEKFKDKKEAQERLKNFLKGKNIDIDLDTVDFNNLPDDQADALNKALEEFKNQKFPDTPEGLRALGLKKKDGSGYTEQELNDLLKNPEKQKELNEIKDMYGFEDNEGGKTGETKKTNPIKPNTENFDGVKNLIPDGKKLTINGNEVPLTQENWETFKGSKEFAEYLQSPEVLKELSKNDFKNEKTDIDAVKDTEDGNPNDEGKRKLSELSLKTIWQKLNDNGISIRALPDYSPQWGEKEKKEAIKKYLLSNSELVKDDNILAESKTSQKRLSSLIEANNKKIQKRSLKKFAELLVNDVRTFG